MLAVVKNFRKTRSDLRERGSGWLASDGRAPGVFIAATQLVLGRDRRIECGVDDRRPLGAHRLEALDSPERDAVLVGLRRLAEHDPRAFVALAWLLVPGASLVAGRLRRLTDAIDEVLAGQLCIQICEHDPADCRYVATTILRRAEREYLAELGLGELAKRRDLTWASSVLIERYDETIPTEEPDAEEPREQLIELLRRALDSGALSDQDRG